jgi:hypothetical protein
MFVSLIRELKYRYVSDFVLWRFCALYIVVRLRRGLFFVKEIAAFNRPFGALLTAWAIVKSLALSSNGRGGLPRRPLRVNFNLQLMQNEPVGSLAIKSASVPTWCACNLSMSLRISAAFLGPLESTAFKNFWKSSCVLALGSFNLGLPRRLRPIVNRNGNHGWEAFSLKRSARSSISLFSNDTSSRNLSEAYCKSPPIKAATNLSAICRCGSSSSKSSCTSSTPHAEASVIR